MDRFSGLRVCIAGLIVALITGAVGPRQSLAFKAAAEENVCLKGTIKLYEFMTKMTNFLGYEDNTISLCFPQDGGSVTGEFNIAYKWDEQDPQGCQYRKRYGGTIVGAYSQGRVTGSVEEWIYYPTDKIQGCEGYADRLDEDADNDAEQIVLDLKFDGTKAVGSMWPSSASSLQMPIEAAVVSGGTQDQDTRAQDTGASGTNGGPDDLEESMDEQFAQAGLSALLGAPDVRTIATKVWMAEAVTNPGASMEYASAVTEQLRNATRDWPLLPPYNYENASSALGSAALMAKMETRDGAPLFPSVRAALPVITIMSVKAIRSNRDLQATERFTTMLAAMDLERYNRDRPGAK